MDNKKCDLHLHSSFSDSDADLQSIFKQAKTKNVQCIAVTDHDTVAGISSARVYSKEYDIELIEGIELSAQYKEIEVHILGYFIDSDNEKFKIELSELRRLRVERISWMMGKLNDLGLKVDEQKFFSRINGAIPTRLHLALYLTETNKVSSLQEAFKKYLSPGKPAYQSRFKYSVKEAINFIKSVGGLAFLAHPHVISDQSLVEKFINLGLDGLEVVYPGMSPVKRSLYGNMVTKFGLLRSGGSDAHGSYKKFIKLGMVNVPYIWVQEMKERLKLNC